MISSLPNSTCHVTFYPTLQHADQSCPSHLPSKLNFHCLESTDQSFYICETFFSIILLKLTCDSEIGLTTSTDKIDYQLSFKKFSLSASYLSIKTDISSGKITNQITLTLRDPFPREGLVRKREQRTLMHLKRTGRKEKKTKNEIWK